MVNLVPMHRCAMTGRNIASMAKMESLVSQNDRDRVSHIVSDAEARTSAEIVPVIAVTSGRYDRPEDLVGLWFGLGALVTVWRFLPAPHGLPGTGDWERVAGRGWQAAALALAVAAGFVIGAWLATRIPWLRRLCTTKGEMRAEVAARARQVFFDQRVHHTAGKGGVLLYVSLYERMASVVADKQVLEKLGQPAIDGLCALLTSKLSASGPIPALCDVIEEAGRLLGPALPREPGDINELADTLVLIEG